MKPRDTLTAFDGFLSARGLELDAVVVGGAALGLLGIITRETRDCDILHPALPDHVRRAAAAFASDIRDAGEHLADDWLNNGPSSLVELLPPGWLNRLSIAFAGRAVTLRTLGRTDLLLTKVFALCDRGIDLADCVALAPTAEELAAVVPWLERQDAAHGWPEHVRAVVSDLQGRVSHGI